MVHGNQNDWWIGFLLTRTSPAEYVGDDYLVYFRFIGRILGKALFDQQLVRDHLAQHIYKLILGWPILFEDMAMVNGEAYKNLLQLKLMTDNGEDVASYCLDFTVFEELMGVHEEIELLPGGKDVEVNNINFPEYLEAQLKYRMLDRIRPQMTEVLLGFFDVIPEPLLTVFDFQELEFLMCGLPVIDIEDWKANSEYFGKFENSGPNHSVVVWFWEVVHEFDQEMKARLLQFATGTSSFPSPGFAVLRGSDGKICRFKICGVGVCDRRYPRAHVGMNCIDLPAFSSKAELREALKLAVTMTATGFGIG